MLLLKDLVGALETGIKFELYEGEDYLFQTHSRSNALEAYGEKEVVNVKAKNIHFLVVTLKDDEQEGAAE